ncbi:hypothetical protein DPEC_G00165750 [Dallia pectoralis]|uniref:Uncharacterized protein n=1 Tax=Dallia pectoralis TaxID=75939 RepID=A0ACC2GH61_DALPE|nr:hypothetical protein DPEC_G00165750 [Dallia pectoralis]
MPLSDAEANCQLAQVAIRQHQLTVQLSALHKQPHKLIERWHQPEYLTTLQVGDHMTMENVAYRPKRRRIATPIGHWEEMAGVVGVPMPFILGCDSPRWPSNRFQPAPCEGFTV